MLVKTNISDSRRIHFSDWDGRTIYYCEFHSWIRQTYFYIR